MTRQIARTQLIACAQIVAPPAPRACTDRSFELPPVIHLATAGLFLASVTTLCLAFAVPGLAIPYAIFVAFILAFFTVPALWTRMAPAEGRTQALGWTRFMDQGIVTATGPISGRDAAVLVLLLPVLLFGWSLAIALIAATVG